VVVDACGLGSVAAGDIEGGKASPTKEKPMSTTSISEPSHNLASVVDATGLGADAVGDIEGAKAPPTESPFLASDALQRLPTCARA